MTPQHALLILGLFTIGAVALCFAALAWMHFTLSRSERRERALPRLTKRTPKAGIRMPMACEFLDGALRLNQAEAASQGIEVRA
ncbi:MAG TPA: hypothetical protein VFF77_00050 [Holophagaceae bacterium]|nr:hypothetical protein [Holophagaceae bacterium]